MTNSAALPPIGRSPPLANSEFSPLLTLGLGGSPGHSPKKTSFGLGGSPEKSSPNKKSFLEPINPKAKRYVDPTENSPGNLSPLNLSPMTASRSLNSSYSLQGQMSPTSPQISPQLTARSVLAGQKFNPATSIIRVSRVAPPSPSLQPQTTRLTGRDILLTIDESQLIPRPHLAALFKGRFTDYLGVQDSISLLSTNKYIWVQRKQVFHARNDLAEHLIRKAQGHFDDIPEKLRFTLISVAHSITRLNVSKCPIEQSDANTLASRFLNLTRLILDDATIDDSKLLAIAKIESLTSLTLSNNPKLSHKSIERLADMLPKLEELCLNHSNTISSSAIASIGHLTNLRRLNLSGCKRLTKHGLEPLKQLAQLQFLGLAHLQVGPSAFENALFTNSLEGLNLCNTRLNGFTFNEIVKLTNLKRLYLEDSEVYDRDMEKLSSLPLAVLSLKNTYVTDQVFHHLLKLPLVSLDISECVNVKKYALIGFVRDMRKKNSQFCCSAEKKKLGQNTKNTLELQASFQKLKIS